MTRKIARTASSSTNVKPLRSRSNGTRGVNSGLPGLDVREGPARNSLAASAEAEADVQAAVDLNEGLKCLVPALPPEAGPGHQPGMLVEPVAHEPPAGLGERGGLLLENTRALRERHLVGGLSRRALNHEVRLAEGAALLALLGSRGRRCGRCSGGRGG